MSIDVPDLQTSTAMIAGSVDRFSTCITSFGPVTVASSVIADKAGAMISVVMSAAASWPALVTSVLTLLVGLALMFLGYKMVRPVNFAAGAYLGGTLSLLLLNIFAPTLDGCPAIVGVAIACSLLLGVLCALKRSTMLAVLGLVTGEILGDVAYKTFLLPLGVPEYGAFFCIGFFAVLLGVLMGNVGDFAVKVVCAFFGSYITVTSSLKLAAPLVPSTYGPGLLAFNAFKPALSQALAKPTVDSFVGSPFVYGPAIALLLLTVVGTFVQSSLLKVAQTSDTERLIRK